MDILKLRYLIREAIEDTIQQQSVFKMGQKVTTKDGDTATITMVEHPYYSVEIESTGTTQSFQFKELAPFVEKVVEPKNEGFLIKENAIVSPGIEFHHNNNLNLLECVYRIGSEAYVNFYAEAKSLFKEGKIQVNGSDKEVLDTDLGEFSLYEITSTVSKRRAGAELKQKLSGKRSDGMGKYDATVYGLDSDGKRVELKNLNDLNKFTDFELAESGKVPLDLPMLEEQMDIEDEIANEEFGMDYDQLGSNEKDWVRDEIDNMSMNEDRKYNQEELLRLDLIARRRFDCDYKNCTDEQKAEVLKDKAKVGVNEAKKKKKKDPPIGKPKRGGSKAYYVYVKDKGKIKKVSFGSGGLRAKINNPKARNAFAARHKCKTKTDRTKPGYWSCRLPRYAKALGLGDNKNTFW